MSTAFAQPMTASGPDISAVPATGVPAQAPPPAFDPIGFFLPLVLVGLIFYFVVVRPQAKVAKEMRAQLSQLSKGDKVVFAGGFIGMVKRTVSETELSVEIAPNVEVTILRSAITTVLTKKDAPANSNSAA